VPAPVPASARIVTQTLRIATRRSPLALWQAGHVQARLEALHPGLRVELVAMTTSGDRLLDAPLARAGGKGLFVKELEQALADGRADLAVHSMKDVPVELPPGFVIAAVLEREDPRDALVARTGAGLDALPAGARVGTSSLRRQCQLRHLRPDLQVLDLRGNVGTRLGRLDAGDLDAVVLAAAGLERLGLAARVCARLDPHTMLPAIGQGAIGIECRAEAAGVRRLVEGLEDPASARRIAAERAFNHRLHGGCQVPIAGYAELDGDTLTLRGLVGRVDGSELLSARAHSPAAGAEGLGTRLAEELLGRGAGAILAACADPHP